MGMKRLVGRVSLFFVVWFIFTLDDVYTNEDGDALDALKKSFSSDPDNVLQSWDATLDNPCTWFHVTCNNNDRVTRVDLGNARLSGQLVSRLGELKSLQYLELYQNNISGSIPDELGNLASLVSLDLYNNNLIGHIPQTLGKLSNLRFFRLNNNRLNGAIPSTMTSISSLQVLDLSNNNLWGVVPIDGSFASFSCVSFRNNPDLTNPNGSC